MIERDYMFNDNDITTVMLEIENEKVKSDIEDAISSLGGFLLYRNPLQVQKAHNPKYYDFSIIEIGDDPESQFQHVKTLQTSGIVAEVFFTSSNTNSDILMEALRMGIRGFFPQPINKEDVRNAFLRIKEQKGDNKENRELIKKGKIINVFGSKGGVGTTTIAVNLAVSLTKLPDNPKVVLIDMNVPLGEIGLHLDMKPGFDWAEAVNNFSRLDSTYLMSALSKHSSGLYVLFSSPKISDNHTVNFESLETLFRVMQTMFDFIVIDGGQSVSDISQLVMKIADKVIIACILNLPCIINLKKLNYLFQELGYPAKENTEIVVNRFLRSSEISAKDIEKNIDKKTLCCIPNAYNIIMNTINRGEPICNQSQNKRKGADISKIFESLASSFSGNGKG